MKPFFVYILKCSDGSYYTGHTDVIEKRISEHRSGLVDGYVAQRRPFLVVYLQEFASRYEALSAERQIKKWSRKKKEALIENDWAKLIQLSKSKDIL